MPLLMIASGCGLAAPSGMVKARSTMDASAESSDYAIGGETTNSPGMAWAAPEEATSSESLLPSSAIPQPVDPARKIIYTASMALVVEDFSQLEARLRETVKQYGGYLSQTELDRMQGERRSGRWTVRVPVDRYDAFLQSVSGLGVPTSFNQQAVDVTEEFVDITARIANQQKLEARILELLDRPGDEIQHVIEVERELARVREAIERMEGRLRYLADQTAMTTVTISAREERDYQPPQAPTLGNRLSSAWGNSLERTVRVSQDALVFFVGNVIGIIAWVLGLVVAWYVLRLAWRRFFGAPASAY
jgi:hypothetical protein